MKRDKYMGIDLHQATSVVYVLDSEGKLVLETIVATEASAVVRLLQSINGPLHVTFEETTQAGWFYEVVRAHAADRGVWRERTDAFADECFQPVHLLFELTHAGERRVALTAMNRREH